jgi:uncharacterized protein
MNAPVSLQITIQNWGIFLASLAGSWHCAGMCGPFGILLRSSRSPSHRGSALYHLGRLVTYSLLTTIVFGFQKPLLYVLSDLGISWVFYSGLFGLLCLWILILLSQRSGFSNRAWAFPIPKWWQRKLGTWIKRQTSLGAFCLGLTTTLLPCAWLYGFVLIAGTQTTFFMAWWTIFLFWAGTIPALFFSQSCVHGFSQRLRFFSRPAGALVAFVVSAAGLYLHMPRLLTPPTPLTRSTPYYSQPRHSSHVLPLDNPTPSAHPSRPLHSPHHRDILISEEFCPLHH